MSQGWLKLHRKTQNWEWYTNSECLHLFIHFLLKAQRKDGNYRGFLLKQGQLSTTLEEIAKQTQLTVQVIRNRLEKLKSTNDITIEATNKRTVISIVNYGNYQKRRTKPTEKEHESEHEKNMKANTKRTQNPTNAYNIDYEKKEEEKKDKKLKEKGNANIKSNFRKPGTTLKEWYEANGIEGIPAEWRQWCIEEHFWSEERILSVAREFWLYWTSDDCPVPKKRNWYQTWQRWTTRERNTSSLPSAQRRVHAGEGMLKSSERIDALTDLFMEKGA